MNLGERLQSSLVKFFDDFVEDGVAGLVAVDFDEKSECFVML